MAPATTAPAAANGPSARRVPGDLSVWGLANAVTRTAEDVADYDRATELEATGGRVIELPRADWRAIAA